MVKSQLFVCCDDSDGTDDTVDDVDGDSSMVRFNEAKAPVKKRTVMVVVVVVMVLMGMVGGGAHDDGEDGEDRDDDCNDSLFLG